jgi:hypothetical protein
MMLWPYQPPAWPKGHSPARFVHYSALQCECGWQSQVLPNDDRCEAQRQEWIAHAAECRPPVKPRR